MVAPYLAASSRTILVTTLKSSAENAVPKITASAEDFKVVTNIVREEAAKYGATTESSLFNESAKRDYDVQGNGYEFNLGQIKFATLNITGDCFLLQKVLDLPAGQLPPEPPIWPTTSTPTP